MQKGPKQTCEHSAKIANKIFQKLRTNRITNKRYALFWGIFLLKILYLRGEKLPAIRPFLQAKRALLKIGQDFYQTYARTRVERGFFHALFCPKHRKITTNAQKLHPFFLRESQVACNSGDLNPLKLVGTTAITESSLWYPMQQERRDSGGRLSPRENVLLSYTSAAFTPVPQPYFWTFDILQRSAIRNYYRNPSPVKYFHNLDGIWGPPTCPRMKTFFEELRVKNVIFAKKYCFGIFVGKSCFLIAGYFVGCGWAQFMLGCLTRLLLWIRATLSHMIGDVCQTRELKSSAAELSIFEAISCRHGLQFRRPAEK